MACSLVHYHRKSRFTFEMLFASNVIAITAPDRASRSYTAMFRVEQLGRDIMDAFDKRTLTETDRAVFRKWAVGVTRFYAAVALIAISAVLLTQHVYGTNAKHQLVAQSTFTGH
jgi:hypothetical protein